MPSESRMILYGCPNSRSLRAAWALERAGAGYDYVLVDLFNGDGRAPWFLAVNPAGKVPVLVDGGLTLTESGAILFYLGEKFPASGLVPAHAQARADCLRWCFFVTTELEQPLWLIAKHRFALPSERRVAGIEQTALWEFARAKSLLERRLDGRAFLAGDAPGAADLLAAHTLFWARSARVALDSPVLEDYAARLDADPALARARAREQAAQPQRAP
jgi:glutathione S-transferase